MVDPEDSPTTLGDLAHLLDALCLKLRVSNYQDLVNDYNLAIRVSRNAERQTHVHPTC